MLIFKKRSITIKATVVDIIKALKELTHQNVLRDSFSEDSFSIRMWEKRNQRMYSAIRFSGTIEEQNDECIVKYLIRPGAGFMFVLLVFIIPFLYAFVLLLFSTVSMKFLTLSVAFPLVISIIIMSQEKVCDERLIRKLHGLEDKEK